MIKQSTARIATTFTALLAAALISLPSMAQNYEAGVHYQPLKKAQPVSTGDKIEVLELFWYGCPHCYDFEPYIQKWQKAMPANAAYVPMPAMFRKTWEFHARAYYTFEALGIVDKAHIAFFDAIHKDRKFQKGDQTPEKLGEWAAQFDVTSEAVVDAYNSFAVDTKSRQAQASLRGYEVTGVPAIIVDGKYRTSGSMAGSLDEVLKVIDFLVAKAAKER